MDIVKAEATVEETLAAPEPEGASSCNATDGTCDAAAAPSTEGSGNATSSLEPSDNATVAEKPRRRVHRKTLTLTPVREGLLLRPMSYEEKAQAQARLRELGRVDLERIERDAAKNQVEAFIFTCREKLAELAELAADLAPTEQESDRLLALAAEVEDWLYEAGANVDRGAYEQKTADLRALLAPLTKRVDDHEKALLAAEKAAAAELAAELAATAAAEELNANRTNATANETNDTNATANETAT